MKPYPFSAIVGHDQLRLALILCAVRPEIGGVLIRGEKGTAKSTAVRGLAALLSHGAESRLVELPIGATEDRVIGSLDLQRVLRDGEHAFSPGCWPAPTAACSTSTRSTCCTIIWSICCSTPRRWAGCTSNATASRIRTRPGSC
ncbi:AAA domain family protein [Mycobacterium xenopi 3993]|nr:AAA domain family protein [Mycobacterium xenopi 3993]